MSKNILYNYLQLDNNNIFIYEINFDLDTYKISLGQQTNYPHFDKLDIESNKKSKINEKWYCLYKR